MITPQTPALSRNETLKESKPLLTGTIAETLSNPGLESFTKDDYEYLKFHGIYQQEDRDKRKTGKAWMYMVRTKFPGGALSADQYLACDRLADQYGNGTLRVTTRQDFQFHGVVKSNLRQTMHDLNKVLISTLGACGDLERNVMAPPTPATSPLVDHVIDEARRLSDALMPQTRAYHQIWVEGTQLSFEEENKSFSDPVYERRYLPRKFKTAFAIPPLNDIDIFTNDLGFIVIANGDKLEGYNMIAGGGLGMSHGNPQTFPRLADVVGFLEPQHLEEVAKAVVTVHRDFGDRSNRKHARLKYVIAERGVKWFKQEVEHRAQVTLQPARPYEFTKQGDLLGWHQQTNGQWFLGIFVENGRILDKDGYHLKTGLKTVVEKFRPEARLTASQNVLFVNVRAEDREAITRILAENGVSVDNPFSATRLASMACPALPTCGLALAESERVLPDMITQFDQLLKEAGLNNQEFIIRATGCPNGCARPYVAEIALVGKGPGRYQLYFGGNEASTRLARVYKDVVKSDELMNELRPILMRYAQERKAGERFGDFSERVLFNTATAAQA